MVFLFFSLLFSVGKNKNKISIKIFKKYIFIHSNYFRKEDLNLAQCRRLVARVNR